jgi:hypothetical protein
MADTTTSEVINEIISIIQDGSSETISDAVQTKITAWTNEIAAQEAKKAAGEDYSRWVIIRDTIWIILSSYAAVKAQSKIRAALAKLEQ